MLNEKHSVEIVESYKSYKPPFDATHVVDRLLANVPSKYVIGIEKVVLRDSESLNRRQKREQKSGKKGREYIVRGQYHYSSHGQPAWIEIFVDNTLDVWPSAFLKLSLCRDAAFAQVLFHEVGHHIHDALKPEHKDKENIAENWGKKLSRYYFQKTYPYLVFVLRPFSGFLERAIRHFVKMLKQ